MHKQPEADIHTMPAETDQHLLAQMPLFRGLLESDRQRLIAEMRVLELPAGAVLFHEEALSIGKLDPRGVVDAPPVNRISRCDRYRFSE